jgi:hypothetical protein
MRRASGQWNTPGLLFILRRFKLCRYFRSEVFYVWPDHMNGTPSKDMYVTRRYRIKLASAKVWTRRCHQIELSGSGRQQTGRRHLAIL